MKRIYIFLAALILLLSSCQTPTKSFNKLTLVVGGCNKTAKCPFMAIEMDEHSNYRQFCLTNCDNTGFFTGVITENILNEINTHLNQTQLENIDLGNEAYRNDEYIEMLIHQDNNTISIKGQVDDFDQKLKESIRYILNLQYQIDLTREVDLDLISLDFEIPIPMDNYYLLPISTVD